MFARKKNSDRKITNHFFTTCFFLGARGLLLPTSHLELFDFVSKNATIKGHAQHTTIYMTDVVYMKTDMELV